MLVTNQNNNSQTVETKTTQSLQTEQSDTNLSTLQNEKIKSTELNLNKIF